MNNTKDKTEPIASEVITDLTKNLILTNDRLESLYGEVQTIQSMFRAIHYSTVEGGITPGDADNCFTGIQNMINILAENVQDAYGMSSSFIKEVL